MIYFRRGGFSGSANSKGREFEYVVAKYWPKYSRRQPMSGAIGTLAGVVDLLGDVIINFPWFSKRILIDAKSGYTNKAEKSINLKKAWFDKIDKESKLAKAFPAICFRFNSLHNAKYIAFNLDDFKELMTEVEGMFDELNILRDALYSKGENEKK